MASRSVPISTLCSPTLRADKGTQKRKPMPSSEVNAIDTQSTASCGTSMKRKLESLIEDDEYEAAIANSALANASPKPNRRKAPRREPEERRLRHFRKNAPLSYLERLERVRTQRMFLLDRERRLSSDGKHQEEVFDIAGTTGNVYQITISRQPTCTCPDALKGNQCKHILYVLVNVLKVPEHLSSQVAFISSELATIFEAVPPTPQSLSHDSFSSTGPGNRKPIEGDCPVCVMEFEPGKEEIVWCRAGCGNNIHQECFEKWAASKAELVKCVYCRTPWKCDPESAKRIGRLGKRNEEGYVNVAAELGIPSRREVATWGRSRSRWSRTY